jgi:hypothetical protein
MMSSTGSAIKVAMVTVFAVLSVVTVGGMVAYSTGNLPKWCTKKIRNMGKGRLLSEEEKESVDSTSTSTYS